MSRFLRILRRIAIGLVTVFLIFAASIFIILWYFEDDVVNYAAEQVGNQLNTKARVGSVDLSFWSTFPYASIHFDDVFIQEPGGQPTDTLLQASDIYLGFSLSDLFTGHYTIRQLKASEGRAALLIDAQGKPNWNIWKENPSDTGQSAVHIETLHISDFHVTYEDRKQEFYTDAACRHLELDIREEDDQLRLQTDARLTLYTMVSGTYILESTHEANVTGAMLINPETYALQLDPSKIVVDRLSATCSGAYSPGDYSSYQFDLQSQNADITDLFSLLPSELRQRLAPYEADGTTDLHVELERRATAGATTEVTAQLEVRDGAFTHHAAPARIEGLQATARYLSTDRGMLAIESLEARLGSGFFRISGDVRDLSHPEVDLHIEANTNLTELREFFAWDTLEVCDGQISLNALVKGRLPESGEEGAERWKSVSLEGSARLEGGSFRIAGSQRLFRDMAGNLRFTGESAALEKLRGTVNGSDFEVNGTADNLLGYLFSPDGELRVDAALKSSLVDFTQLTDQGSISGSSSFHLPRFIYLQFRTDIERFTYKTFAATQVTGLTTLRHGGLRISPVTFNLADGAVTAHIALVPVQSDAYLVESTATIRDMQIEKVFQSFDNFGQSFITYHHLRGRAQAEVAFRTKLSGSMDIQPEQVYALVDVRIDNGELIGLESLQEIASYVREHKLIAPFVHEERFAEKLAHVRFSTLENVIRVEEGVVHIPQMDIRSSAMDISVAGTHRFDQAIDYTIGFRLRDILVRKEKEIDEADDGLGRQMFVYMRGNSSSPEFGMDKEAARRDRRDEIAAERQNVRALLRQDLGLFRKDSSLDGIVPIVPESPGSTISIEWEDTAPARDTGASAPPANAEQKTKTSAAESPRKKKLPKWLEEREEYEENQ